MRSSTRDEPTLVHQCRDGERREQWLKPLQPEHAASAEDRECSKSCQDLREHSSTGYQQRRQNGNHSGRLGLAGHGGFRHWASQNLSHFGVGCRHSSLRIFSRGLRRRSHLPSGRMFAAGRIDRPSALLYFRSPITRNLNPKQSLPSSATDKCLLVRRTERQGWTCNAKRDCQ
jgi:hypothetical protein